MYVLNSSTGKYTPVKGSAPLDPFQESLQTLNNFDSTTVNQVDNTTYEITVMGGKLPKFVDHAMIRLDSSANEITHVEGVDTKGSQVLNMDLTYKKVSGFLQVQHVDSQVSSKNMSMTSTMDVVTNEINANINDSVFSVQ